MADYPTEDDCIFCKIVAGDIPAAIIHQDQDLVAFMDAFPSSEGHALVIPRGHYENVVDLPPELMSACSLMVQRLAKAARTVFSPDGITILQFNGEAAGQTVFHYHQHVIPRWAGQDWSAHGKTQGDPELLQRQAAQLRDALK